MTTKSPIPWKMESQRSYFAKALIELGERDADVVVVGGDTTESVKTLEFGKKFPDRLFNVGISEQNMVSIAAGLAAAGKIAFASTYAVFGIAHTYNVIRQNIAYTKLPVKLFCSHTGISVGPDGATHQLNEDIGLMRGLPNMTVLVPADGPQTAKCVHAAAAWKGPVYCRFSRANFPTVTSLEDPFTIGPTYAMRDGSDVTLAACGVMVSRCLQAADELDGMGVSARVLNVPTVKPMDTAMILKAARETGALVTAEEHTVVHGLGSAIAAAITKDYPVPVEIVGIEDVFGESGEAFELMDKYGLTAANVVEAARRAMKRRGRKVGH